jgi:LysR family transcriptional regulator, glycine cleavage system transcriptional activator
MANYLPSSTALRCFDASVRLGNLTKAALEVHLTQGAVSQQILALEKKLGLRLFVRSKSGLQLTSAGRSYWTEVSGALRQIERATQNIINTKGDGGTLTISVASTLGTFWLMPRLRRFVATHPEITINLSTQIGPIDFSVSPTDAAIEFCDGEKSGLAAKLIMPLSVRPFISTALKKNIVSRKQLANFLNKSTLIRHTTVLESWQMWLASANLIDLIDARHTNSGPQYDLLSMALNAVIEGLGIALLPDYLVEQAVANRQIEPLSNVYWTADKAYYLRYPLLKNQLPSLLKFERWILTELQN